MQFFSKSIIQARFSLRSPVSRNQYIVLLLCPCCHGCRLPCMWPLLSLRWCLLLIMRWPHNNNAVFFKVNYSRFSLRSPVSRNQHIVLLLCPCCHGCRLPCMWPLLSLRWCLLLIMRWSHNNNAVAFKVNYFLLRAWVSSNQTLIIGAMLPLYKYFIVW